MGKQKEIDDLKHALLTIKTMLDFEHSDYQKYLIWKTASEALEPKTTT